jgi:hypothetical protein
MTYCTSFSVSIGLACSRSTCTSQRLTDWLTQFSKALIKYCTDRAHFNLYFFIIPRLLMLASLNFGFLMSCFSQRPYVLLDSLVVDYDTEYC